MPKKKTALTIEERLQQALVPAEEQPYEVSENWVWVRLENICEYMKAGGDKPKDFSAEKVEGKEIPVVANGIEDEGIIGYTSCSGELSGSLTVAGRGTIGYSFIRMYDFFPVVRLLVVRPYDFVNLKMLKYVFDAIPEKGKGSSIPQLTIPMIKEKAIPLPPLSEQQRIVERIEELFAKLDEAKERLQEVADSFAVRKAAILHKAFTGELIGKQVTELVPLENLVDLIKIGPFGSSLHESDYIENGIPLVNPKHIVQQRIVPQSKISISDEKAEELSSYKLKENDIVLGRRGEMGRCAPISNREENWICGTGSMIIRLKKEYDAKLYSLILGSQATVTYLENSAVGSTLKNLNEKIVRKIPVPQFSNEEQHEIVRLIDDLLARERKAQQATEQALASIDLMKKSILARAFRGELGTNKASEASALELLRQVLAED